MIAGNLKAAGTSPMIGRAVASHAGGRSVVAKRLQLFRDRQKACKKLQREMNMDCLWSAMVLFTGYPFTTAKGLKFTYSVRGGELFVDRKMKSITKSTVNIAFQKVVELKGNVSGPKKLGVFGASYLYPLFIRLGLIRH